MTARLSLAAFVLSTREEREKIQGVTSAHLGRSECRRLLYVPAGRRVACAGCSFSRSPQPLHAVGPADQTSSSTGRSRASPVRTRASPRSTSRSPTKCCHRIVSPATAAGGVDLGSFLVGDYQLTITGFDGAGVQTHQVVQTLQVRGRSGGRDEIAVDVPRVADSTTADLTWTFSPGPDCATANVQQVTIYIDPNPDGTGGTNAGTVACSTMGTAGCLDRPAHVWNAHVRHRRAAVAQQRSDSGVQDRTLR